MSTAFSNAKETQSYNQNVPVEKLYAQIVKQKIELNFLKKCNKICDTRVQMETIKLKRSTLSMRKQCELLCVPNSSHY